jgi:Flp pilus assembly protein TadB
MILLPIISLVIASKWKGSLTRCGFIGMAIYCLLAFLAGAGHSGGYGAGYALGQALVFSVFLIWIPVWIVMIVRARAKRRQEHESTQLNPPPPEAFRG